MGKLQTALALSIASLILLCAGAANAITIYTTDTQETPLRNTPSVSGKTLAVIPPASGVELVNPNSYTKVRFKKPDGQLKEGWIATRFLNSQPPDSSVSKALGAENESLNARLDELEQEKTGLSEKEKELTEKLIKLNSAYEELKGGSANYLKFKSEYDSTKASLASAQENIQMLNQENENLRVSHNVWIFLAGASVLLAGWILGLVTRKWRKKRKGTYYY